MSALTKSPESMQQIDVIKIYQKKRCLVIDDLTDVRASYKRMLSSFGVKHLDTAATGDQAIELCETRQYDMILCDYNLGDSRDGQQLLEELRYLDLLKYTTLFIIITAETSREMVLGAIENQPDDYITKPISQKLMRSRLDKALLKHEELYNIKSAMDTKDYTKAISLCDEKIKAKHRFSWDCIRYKAQIYWLMGDFAKAEQIYDAILKDKDFVWAKLGLARAKMKNSHLDGIEDILNDILSIDHRYIEAYDLFSEYYEKKELHEKAQAATAKATALSPKSVIRHRRLAKLAEFNDDDAACLKSYEESIRWNYNSCHASPEDYLGLARKTVEVTKGKKGRDVSDKTKKALALLDRMHRRFPDQKNIIKASLIESQIYANQGKEKQAVDTLKTAETKYDVLEEKDAAARLDFAQAHLASGDKQRAKKELITLVKQCENDPKMVDKIDRACDEPISPMGKANAANLSKEGIGAYQAKEYDKAIDIFNRTLRMFPNHVGVNLNLVQTLIAKSEADGKTAEYYYRCKKCFEKTDGLDSEHKQHARHDVLYKQFMKLYDGYEEEKK